jgi:antitoxin component YwqK of YwqJK toxin-antitoxin module
VKGAPGLLGLALLLGAATLAGCKSSEVETEIAAPEPELRRLRLVDRQTGALVRSWTVLAYPDGRQVKHGQDLRWYPSGSRLSEGAFEHGQPTGRLRRWHPNGQLQSESTFDPAGGLTPMTFWHVNGALAAQGQARAGRREGLWEHRYLGGALRERGGYIDGRRTGLWTLYHEDGSVKSIGRFEKDERVGAWQHFEPGERLELSPRS